MIDFLFEQNHLDKMSKEISLFTNEVHEPNDYYGQASILREYCTFPFSLKVIYEHSLPFHDIIWNVDENSKCLVAFVSSEYRYEVYKNKKIKKIIFNIGSIMNYVIYNITKKNIYNEIIRKGSVYFPPHSTHHIESVFNSDLIIKKLKELPEKFQPIKICMYWKDIQLKRHQIYIDNGFEVISAGHIYDKMFYYRLYDILIRFNYSLGSSFGSFVFHSAICGTKVYFPESLRIKEGYKISTKDFVDPEFEGRMNFVNRFEENAILIFSDDKINYSPVQKDFINKYCSSKLYSKKKLFLILLFADFLYIFRNFYRIFTK